MKSRYVWLLLLLVMFVILVLIQVKNKQEPPLDSVAYRESLNELIEAIVMTTLPLAQIMAQGQQPSTANVEQSQAQLMTIHADLKALGRPPQELAPAHAHIVTAIQQFQQAYDHLAENLVAGLATPFDHEFLMLTRHGGEAVHQAAAMLDN